MDKVCKCGRRISDNNAVSAKSSRTGKIYFRCRHCKNEFQRLRYKNNKAAVLESNKRSRLKLGHTWKHPRGIRRIRPSYENCSGCGDRVRSKSLRRLYSNKFQGGVKARLCKNCWPEHEKEKANRIVAIGCDHPDLLGIEWNLLSQIMDNVLKPRDKRILLMRKDGWKLREIAEVENLSFKRIRQIVSHSIRCLRGWFDHKDSNGGIIYKPILTRQRKNLHEVAHLIRTKKYPREDVPKLVQKLFTIDDPLAREAIIEYFSSAYNQ